LGNDDAADRPSRTSYFSSSLNVEKSSRLRRTLAAGLPIIVVGRRRSCGPSGGTPAGGWH